MIYNQIVTWTIEVASVIDRKGLARAGSWFMTEGELVYQIYLPAIDTIVTGMAGVGERAGQERRVRWWLH